MLLEVRRNGEGHLAKAVASIVSTTRNGLGSVKVRYWAAELFSHEIVTQAQGFVEFVDLLIRLQFGVYRILS